MCTIISRLRSNFSRWRAKFLSLAIISLKLVTHINVENLLWFFCCCCCVRSKRSFQFLIYLNLPLENYIMHSFFPSNFLSVIHQKRREKWTKKNGGNNAISRLQHHHYFDKVLFICLKTWHSVADGKTTIEHSSSTKCNSFKFNAS